MDATEPGAIEDAPAPPGAIVEGPAGPLVIPVAEPPERPPEEGVVELPVRIRRVEFMLFVPESEKSCTCVAGGSQSGLVAINCEDEKTMEL